MNRIVWTGLAAIAFSLSATPVFATPGGPTAFNYNTTFYLSFSASQSAAQGSAQSSGSGTGGGLCTPGGSCPSPGVGKAYPIETANGGYAPYFVFSAPAGVAPGTDFLLTFSFAEYSTNLGDVLDVAAGTPVSGGGYTFQDIGTTADVGNTTAGGANTLRLIIKPSQNYAISFTDLTLQYDGQTDPYGGGTVTATSSVLSFTMNEVMAPEPASLSVMLGGLAALGLARRRDGRPAPEVSAG